MTTKSTSVTMTDNATGEKFKWSFWRTVGACNVTLGKKPKKVTGYSFKDHEGYERFQEGNFHDFLERFTLTASNYGFTFFPLK